MHGTININIFVLVIMELMTRTELFLDVYWFTRHSTTWSGC